MPPANVEGATFVSTKAAEVLFVVAEFHGVFLVEVSSNITSYQQMKWPLILYFRSSHVGLFES